MTRTVATALAPLPKGMREDAFQSVLLDLARRLGWMAHHTRAVQIRPGRWATPLQGIKGFPDLVLAHAVHGVIVAELKSDRGTPEPEQKDWLNRLAWADLRVYVLRPRHWLDAVVPLLNGEAPAVGRWVPSEDAS